MKPTKPQNHPQQNHRAVFNRAAGIATPTPQPNEPTPTKPDPLTLIKSTLRKKPGPRTIAIAGVAGLVLACLVYGFLLRPALVTAHMKRLLRDRGFETVAIADLSRVKDGYNFRDITLDKENRSTIRSLTLQDEKDDSRTLTIDRLSLAGQWDRGAFPVIAGMRQLDLAGIADDLRKNRINSIILNAGQIDLVVPLAGAIRLQAKGTLDVLKDGTIRLRGTAWGDQKEFKGQIDIKGEFTPDGSGSVDFDIMDNKIDLGTFVAGRISGWTIFTKKPQDPAWTVSAQVNAGSARLYTLPLQGATFSVQGTMQDAALALLSEGMEHATALAVDAQLSTTKQSRVTVTARTGNLRQLVKAALSGIETDEETDDTIPGGVITYRAQAPNVGHLMKNGTFAVTGAKGPPWMTGTLRRTESGMDMDIQQAPIKMLTAVFGPRKLQGDGPMTGLLSLRANDSGAIIIESGLLRAAKPGVISYDGRALPDRLESDQPNAVDLLKSFAYDRLDVTVNTAERGLDGNITLNGKTLLNGQKPAEIHLHFDSEL